MKRCIIIFFLIITGQAIGQSLHFAGQASSWGVFSRSDLTTSHFGMRYVPELSFETNPENRMSLSLESALNLWGTTTTTDWKHFEWDGDIKPYRLWARWGLPRFELRIGLQKLSFGAAFMLRPMMWFDRIDPRDPLQMTDGVYALLMRYYFYENANLWLWGLYGNSSTRGLDFIPSDSKVPEFGGRVQTPLFIGEIALTAHSRLADISQFMIGGFPLGQGSIREYKAGLDGKWDWVIGFWFESMLLKYSEPVLNMTWQKAVSIGLDYTFSLGNGLHALVEHMNWATSSEFKPTDQDQTFDISALAIDYPFGISDILSGMMYYDWENQNLYRFISWRHTTDSLTLHLIGFWNPTDVLFFQTSFDSNPFAGAGIQLMLVLNH